jgi:hypothetical protein
MQPSNTPAAKATCNQYAPAMLAAFQGHSDVMTPSDHTAMYIHQYTAKTTRATPCQADLKADAPTQEDHTDTE